ncbi:MAG: hypothetical protein EBU96_12580, partial [Actinobacteria bacterium]|nr:hypothetical protein [Actinomycetota bacterium]
GKILTNIVDAGKHADYLAARVEYEQWKDSKPSAKIPNVNAKKTMTNTQTAFDISKIFGE